MPVVSIIVPVYKVEKYLEFCVKSLINQTLKDIEIILVDDGSPDNCGKICDMLAETDGRIKVIHKSNGGLSSARNAGLDIAKGDYIGFVDSDDWVEPDMYEYLLALIKKYDADVADCEMLETSKREYTAIKEIENVEKLNQKEALDVFFRVSKSNINYCVCDKLFKKEIFEKVKFTEGIIFEDIDFNYRALIGVKTLVVSNVPKYYYYKNLEGISRNSFRKKDLELLEVWDNIVELSKTYTPEHEIHAKFNRNRADFGLLCKMFKYGCRDDGDYSSIRKELLKSVRKNFTILFKGRLPLNRKILLVLMAINYRLVAYPLWIKRKIQVKMK